MWNPLRAAALLWLTVLTAGGITKDVVFSLAVDVGFGNEVCVSGAAPALGGGDPLRAVKLAWTPGNVWTGDVALEAGSTSVCQFVSRNFAATSWTSPSNTSALGAPFPVVAPAHSAPPWHHKTVLYRTSWAAPRVLFRDRSHNGDWLEQPLTPLGAGRMDGEQTFRATGMAPSGSDLEFVFHDGAGTYDNAPPPPTGTAQGAAPAVPAPYQGISPPHNYRTTLDVFLVQDGQVFNYMPSNTVTAPRTELRDIASTVPGIPGRPVTILLPRGYDQNTGKYYPVIYFHDGQNVFFPGGPFGTWDADRIAGFETAQGRMRETILVAIPNGNEFGSNRLREYLPTGDSLLYSGTTYEGAGAAYARFLLDNVMPTLDTHYRTLGNARDTQTAGSSMGGLVSDYLTDLHPDRFGTAGIFSPAYWAAPVWVEARAAAARKPLHRYLYMGTAESSTGESSSQIYWAGALQAYDVWVRAGHVIHGDLRFEGGAGAAHNEAAWSRRLPSFLGFALDPLREAQPLALTLYPPTLRIESISPASTSATLRYHGLFGVQQHLESSATLANWSTILLPPEAELWAQRDVQTTLPASTGTVQFLRLNCAPWLNTP